VLDNTGFELVVSERVDKTSVPAPKVVAVLRELDPHGFSQKEVTA
jgi:hypothetical protein